MRSSVLPLGDSRMGRDKSLCQVNASIALARTELARASQLPPRGEVQPLPTVASAAVVSEVVLAPGAVVGSYQLQRQLGMGGEGEVWSVRHATLGTSWALKLMHRGADVARLEREARITARLRDAGVEGIALVPDVGVLGDGRSYMVVEMLKGRTLQEEIEEHARRWTDAHGAEKDGSRKPEAYQLPVARAIQIVEAIALVLDQVHRQGIVHRDLKPANIFVVSGNGHGERFVVLDFGFARELDPLHPEKEEQAEIGTPAYMPPEQTEGNPADARSDVYALASISHELLTGRWTHQHRAQFTEAQIPNPLARQIANIRDMMAGKREDKVELASKWRPDLPKRLVQLLARSLDRDPRRRPGSMDEFIAGLRAAKYERVEEAGQPARSAWRWVVRLVVLAALVVGGWFAAKNPQVQTIWQEQFAPLVEPWLEKAKAEAFSVWKDLKQGLFPSESPKDEKAPEPKAEPKPVKRVSRSRPAPEVVARPKAKTPADWLAEADQLLKDGKLEEARLAYLRGASVDQGRAREGSAKVYFRQRKYIEAAELARQAVERGQASAQTVLDEANAKLGRTPTEAPPATPAAPPPE